MAQVFPSRAQALYEEGKVSVISHRGDWRNTPENSIRAIQNCIDLGVNMVEIDIKKTKDNELILLHDKTLDRTTTGKGLPQDYTCLLYTSPSPRDTERSRMPSSA